MTTARAKGLSEVVVTMKHAFRNSLISVIAVVGFTFVGLASGTVITETVFSLPASAGWSSSRFCGGIIR